MIYTVTLNPSLDYIVSVENFKPGMTNRTSSELMLPGGKGLNVSIVLKNLGIENTALGFAAGFTGKEIIRRIQQMGVKSDLILIPEGISRINLKLKLTEETEINGCGPDIRADAMQQLMDRLSCLTEGDVLVLAGSIPGSVSDDIYKKIMERLKGHGVAVVVDAAKTLLLRVLEYHPFLVKPNHHELGEIFQTELHTRKEVIPYAEKLQEMGAKNVLVSLAEEGAVLVTETKSVMEMPAPKGTLINGVGAGDSMVAGFIAGWLRRQDYKHAFCMGVAAGSASAFSKQLAAKAEIERLYQQMIGENF